MADDLTRTLLMSQDRVTSLRLGIVEVIAKVWPDWLKFIEGQLGKRLSEIPDSVLLGYFEAAATLHSVDQTSKSSVSAPESISEIVGALNDCGFPLDHSQSSTAIATAIKTGFYSLKTANERLLKERNEARKLAGDSAKPSNVGKLSWAESGMRGTTKKDTGKVQDQLKLPGVYGIDDDDFGLEDETPKTEENLKKQAEEILSIPQESLQRIRALLKSTTPRFMSDVVSLVDSADIAAVWEKNQREHGDIALINPQDRHRTKGALIVPKDALRKSIPNFDSSLWGKTLKYGYRGGNLFHAAAVLRQLGDSAITMSCKDTALEIIVKEHQGNYGMVVALAEGGEWMDTTDSIGELVNAREFSKVLVLVCPREQDKKIDQAIKETAQFRKWRQETPVLVADLTRWLASGSMSALPADTA